MDEIEINRLELLAEDLEAYHLAMDDEQVARSDANGNKFSAYGRALVFANTKNKDERIKELEETVGSMEEDVRYLNALRAADIV